MFNYFKKFQTKYSFIFTMMFIQPYKYLQDGSTKLNQYKYWSKKNDIQRDDRDSRRKKANS